MASSEGIKIKMKPSVKELKVIQERRLTKLQNMATPFKKISIMLDRWVQQNFRTEGGLVGGWLGLIGGGRWKKGIGIDTSAKILQDSGRLRASFLPFADKKDAGIGSDLPYAKPHEEGSANAGSSYVKRRMLPERGDVIDKAKKLLEDHVEVSIK